MAKRERDRIIFAIIVGLVIFLVAIVAFATETGAKSGEKHDNTILWALGALQAIQAILWGWIKLDIKDLWKRANNHGHSIECEATGCKPKTTGVLIRE